MGSGSVLESAKKSGFTYAIPTRKSPERRAALPHVTEPLAGSSGTGHDFGQVRVARNDSAQAEMGQCQILSTPRTCPFGGACHTCPTRIQAKLVVGQPDDEYEREADRVAEQVMRTPESPKQSAFSSQHSAASSRHSSFIARHSSHPVGIEVSPGVEAQIQSLRGGGQPLSASERAFFEPRLGLDFSGTRIHSGLEAAEAARAVNARAFTVGQDIVFGFGFGRHEPDTQEGQILLAHELAHVVQQNQKNEFVRLQRSPAVFGDAVLFEIIPQCPPAARVLGSFPDEDIAAELYGDASYPVMWSMSDADAIDVDMNALREEWRPYFADSICATEETGGPSPPGNPATALVAMADVGAFFHRGGGATVRDLGGQELRITAISVDQNHADVVPQTADDTQALRDNCGYRGDFCAWCCDRTKGAGQACASPGSAVLWTYRACRVEIDSDPTSGRWIAAAHHCCPHAGAQDGHNFGFNDTLTDHAEDNQYPGHFCLHFLHSRTHRGSSERADAQSLINDQAAAPQATP